MNSRPTLEGQEEGGDDEATDYTVLPQFVIVRCRGLNQILRSKTPSPSKLVSAYAILPFSSSAPSTLHCDDSEPGPLASLSL